MRPVAVLLCRTRGQAEAGAECGEAIAQCLAEEAPQIGAERAQHAAHHHMEAPQQQSHAAHQVQKNHRPHRVRTPRYRSGTGTPCRKAPLRK